MQSSFTRFLLFILILVGLGLGARLIFKPQSSNSEAGVMGWLNQIFSQSAKSPNEPVNRPNTLIKQQPKSNFQPNADSSQDKSAQKLMYRWLDDAGNLKFTQTPPKDREYQTVTYTSEPTRQPGSISPSRQYEIKNNKPTQYLPNVTTRQQSTARNDQTDIKDLGLSLQCTSQLNHLKRFEKKLDKSKDVAQSIWLQDYCSALSELIQTNCVIAKKYIKYNQWCGVRYRR
ncbi:DUF4124 domain-containing protein [Aliikangiella sp. IMCC44632]